MFDGQKKTRLTLVLCAALVTVAACGGSPSRDQQIQRAAQSVDSGDYGDAEVRLKNLLQSDKEDARAWFLLGQVSLARYRYADAVEQLDRARSQGRDSTQVALPLAEALIALGQHDKALETLTNASAEEKETKARLLALRGQAYLGLDSVNEAEQAFDKALEIDPSSGPALVGKAQIASDTGDRERAHTLLVRATDKAPDYGPAWWALAYLSYSDNKCDAASPQFSQYLSLKRPGPPAQAFRARAYLAECQLRLGEIAAATDNIGTLMKQAPDHPFANYLQALIDLRSGNREKAARHLQRVLSRAPDSVRSLTLLASIKLSQDDKASAEAYLNQALAKTPTDVAALRLLTGLYLQRDEGDRAVRMLESAYAKSPDSSGIRTLLAQAMAWRSGSEGASTEADTLASRIGDDAGLQIETAAAMARAGNTAAAAALIDATDPENPDEQLRASAIRIGIALHDGHTQQAIEAAQKLVADAPDDVMRLRLLAQTYARTGQLAQAADTLDRALEITPDNSSLAIARADLYARQGEIDNARKSLEGVLDRQPDDLRAQLGLAKLAQVQGDRAAALEWIEKAHASHPDNVEVGVNLVRAYVTTGNVDQAVDAAEKMRQRDPDNATLNRALGIAQLAAGRNEEAIGQLDKAAELAKNDPAYRLDLAQAQIAAKRADDALKTLQRLREEHPDFLPAVSVLARLQAQQGDADKALETIQAVEVDDDNRVALKVLQGDIYAQLDDYAQAVRAYANAYRLQPARALALSLFEARRRTDVSDPEASLQDWLKRRPDDTAVALRLAQWYQANGQTDTAAQAYRTLLSSDPDNAAALNNLALILSDQGNQEDAIAHARRAHEAAPDVAAIADTLGWLLARSGKRQEALPLLRQAAKQMPDDPNVQYHLAYALAEAGDAADKDRARKILEELVDRSTPFDERKGARSLLSRLENGTKNE